MNAISDDVVVSSLDQVPAGWPDADEYDRWLAPITRRLAEDVVRALDLGPEARLLDVAAGTGSLTLAAAATGAEVLAVDFSPAMVALLRHRFSRAGYRVSVAEMDGQDLAVQDGTFDAAASAFGLIFFPDTPTGARELRRALRVGGRAAVTAWGPDDFALQTLALEALSRTGIEDPGRATLPAAFRLSDPSRLEALLIDAGFLDVVVQQLQHAVPIADPEGLFRSIPAWSAPMRPAFERLDEAQLTDGAAAFDDLVRERSGPDGLRLSALLAIGSR